ncbi:MAG: hypothetical protein ACO395_04660 [Pontimonas sp.]
MTNENTQPPTVVEEIKQRLGYEVSWTMIYEGDSPKDAVRQAIASLHDVLAGYEESPNLFIVRSTSFDEDEMHIISHNEALEDDGTE